MIQPALNLYSHTTCFKGAGAQTWLGAGITAWLVSKAPQGSTSLSPSPALKPYMHSCITTTIGGSKINSTQWCNSRMPCMLAITSAGCFTGASRLCGFCSAVRDSVRNLDVTMHSGPARLPSTSRTSQGPWLGGKSRPAQAAAVAAVQPHYSIDDREVSGYARQPLVALCTRKVVQT